MMKELPLGIKKYAYSHSEAKVWMEASVLSRCHLCYFIRLNVPLSNPGTHTFGPRSLVEEPDSVQDLNKVAECNNVIRRKAILLHLLQNPLHAFIAA